MIRVDCRSTIIEISSVRQVGHPMHYTNAHMNVEVCVCVRAYAWKTKRNIYLPINKFTKWQMLAVIHTNKSIFSAEISTWLTSFQQQNVHTFTQKTATLISLEQQCLLPRFYPAARTVRENGKNLYKWINCTISIKYKVNTD